MVRILKTSCCILVGKDLNRIPNSQRKTGAFGSCGWQDRLPLPPRPGRSVRVAPRFGPISPANFRLSLEITPVFEFTGTAQCATCSAQLATSARSFRSACRRSGAILATREFLRLKAPLQIRLPQLVPLATQGPFFLGTQKYRRRLLN